MGATQAFQQAFAAGQKAQADARLKKQELDDEQRQFNFKDLRDQRNNLQTQMRALMDENQNVTPENKARYDELSTLADNVQLQMNSVFRPSPHDPGLLQRHWPFLTKHLTGKGPQLPPSAPQSVTTKTPDLTIQPEAPPMVSFPDLPAYQDVAVQPGEHHPFLAEYLKLHGKDAVAPGVKGASVQGEKQKPLNPYNNPEDQPHDVSFAFNQPWAKPGPYATQLPPEKEAAFQQWAKDNPKFAAGELGPYADYDVRGHWLAAQQGDPEANLTPSPYDGTLHGSDRWKTPYNGNFSGESQYAISEKAPRWVGDTLLTKDGKLVVDESPRTIPGSAFTVTGPSRATSETMAVPTPNVKGLKAPGNIPIWDRAKINNSDGTVGSEDAVYYNDDNPNSPYHNKAVLVPTVVNGKYLTPDGTKPKAGSPEEQAMNARAWQRYRETGEQLGVFEDAPSAERYKSTLQGRSKRPDAAAYQTPYERKVQAAKDRAHQDQQQALRASPAASVAQQALAEAHAQVKKNLALVNEYMEEFKRTNPNATSEETEERRRYIFDQVAGFKIPSVGVKWIYKQAWFGDKNVPAQQVRYNEKDPYGKLQYANGYPVPDDLAAKVEFASGKISKGLSIDKVTGMVRDGDSGKEYARNDPNIPADKRDDVQRMFTGYHLQDMLQKQAALDLAAERGKAYNMARPMKVLDTQHGNVPVTLSFAEVLKDPYRYLPDGAGEKALGQVNLIEDIARQSRAERAAIVNMKEDFPADMRAEISYALTADDHGTAWGKFMASNAIGMLTEDQQTFLIAARQMSEQAMAMRSILNAGTSSDRVRAAIDSTLPSLLTPSRGMALSQLDAFDKTLEQLHQGIMEVPLNVSGWTVKDGGPGDRQPPKEGVGGTAGGGTAGGGTQPRRSPLVVPPDTFKGPKGSRGLHDAMGKMPGASQEKVIQTMHDAGYSYTLP